MGLPKCLIYLGAQNSGVRKTGTREVRMLWKSWENILCYDDSSLTPMECTFSSSFAPGRKTLFLSQVHSLLPRVRVYMELRWDPIRDEWIVVSGARKDRPVTAQVCPFCPGAAEVPDANWKVLNLPNRFPALLADPPEPELKLNGVYRSKPAKGVCEIVVYSPDHSASLANLGLDHIQSVIELWTARFKDLGRRNYVKYVFIFENKGREIGTTLDHPHGQIYAFPFIPPLIRKELSSSKRYWRQHGTCIFCRIIEKERSDRSRLVHENKAFISFLPFFARWPYGVHIYPKRHVQALSDLTVEEQQSYAAALKEVLTRFENLFDTRFPYMMVMHQRPCDGRSYPYYHFHVEFYPPYRERSKIKHFASVETGAGVVTFDYSPETKAKELREAAGPTNRQ